MPSGIKTRTGMTLRARPWRQGRSLIPGLRPAEILVIGDTDRDIQCARTIGAMVLAVATGPQSISELEGLEPDWAVAHLTGLQPAHLS